MTEDKPQPPLSEPVTVPCLYVTGMGIEVAYDVVRIIGWVGLPDLGGETAERRIVIRMAMPNEIARNLATQLRSSLSRGGQ